MGLCMKLQSGHRIRPPETQNVTMFSSEWRESASRGDFEQKARGTADPAAALPKEGRKYMLAEHADQISIHNSQIAESQGQRKLGWHVELLEASRGQHKDLWEFHVSHYHCLNQSHTSPPQPEPGSLPTGQGPPTAQAQGQGVVLDSLPLTPSTQSFSFYLKPGHLYPPPTPPTATPSICCPDCYSCHRRSCFPPAHLESAHLPVANGFSQPNMVRSFLLNVSECVQQHSTLAKSLLSPSWLWAGGGIP
ncbi:synaptonemal complex central element protein 1-like isoform X7 [Phacochoerus africanus]|uniref:synaptonemal complex central element protein 1-like isoform X7 n=1 Tax=Phacochoerus africanus TaxID=41426 RepID=UPI001FD8AB11|nr:synaptonemal complex central element protein 1-like isoform X7 [Phacochoerus africanus]